jgi:hypothetical protein
VTAEKLLEGIGWQVAQFGVQAHAVVEGHDVISDIRDGLGVVTFTPWYQPARLTGNSASTSGSFSSGGSAASNRWRPTTLREVWKQTRWMKNREHEAVTTVTAGDPVELGSTRHFRPKPIRAGTRLRGNPAAVVQRRPRAFNALSGHQKRKRHLEVA